MNCRLNWVVITLFTLIQNFFAQATDYTPRYARFNINRISTLIYNDGRMDHNIETGEAAFEYPKGSGKTVVYQSGFFWGGWTKQIGLHIGGSIYRTGLKPGAILADESAEDPNSRQSRVFRVRGDYRVADFHDDIEKDEIMYEDVITQYKNDWNEWPADKGAPFEDVDGNGIYNPSKDAPGVPGADQTLWFVANDFDTVQSKYFVPSGYPNLPVGIEMHVTIWGYDRSDFLGNVIFKKYEIINKNQNNIKTGDIIVSYFCDPHIDESNFDFVGCDTVINLGFAYDMKSLNEKYSYKPPSIGCLLLQGPSVHDDNHNVNLLKSNLGMTSFNYVPFGFRYGESHFEIGCYNLLTGRKPHTGQYFLFPEEFGGGRTMYPFCGDPVTRIGWLDSYERELWDRQGHRIMVNSGPFNMAHGDTQEVIFAVIAGGAEPGIDNIGAVDLLKHYARQVQQFYDNNFEIAEAEVKPQIIASAFNREVILSWGSDVENVTTIEKNNIHDFSFQGYNVYQLPSDTSSIENGIKIATFDKIDETSIIIEDKIDIASGRVVPTVVQEGRNTGIDRFVQITNDYMFDNLLNNGTKYHYGVTAYYYNPNESTSPVTLETEPSVVSIIPHDENPGISYTCKSGASIYAIHLQGSSDADIGITIIDPSQLTGHDYEITFYESPEQLLWNLEDITSGEIKLTHQTNITGTDEYYIVDGFRVIITQDTSCQLTSSDVFTFNTPVVTKDEELAKLDVEKINVFPNPYYGGHGNELNQYHNYVMFNHLPQRATFRIFNLAGHLVRTLYKDDDSQFYLWDLQNENRLQAPSGLYIIYIEMPDLQKVKVLKLAIVQREVVPGNF